MSLRAGALCRSQAAGSLVSVLATVGQVLLPGCVWVPVCGLLADSWAHTALLSRLLLGFVDQQHSNALLGYGRGVTRWSVWFDAKANGDALQAAAAWCSLCFALLLFALVSLGGSAQAATATADGVRLQWHVLLSCLVFVLQLLLRDDSDAAPRSTPPLVALAFDAAAGCGELRGAGLLALTFAAAVLLVEGWSAHGFASAPRPTRKDPGTEPFELPPAGSRFEQHLHAERRLSLLYCWHELAACERAWKREEREELWSTWTAQFAVAGAPFAVRGLAELVQPRGRPGGDDWAPASPAGVSAARAWLRAELCAALERYEAARRAKHRPAPDVRWGQCLERDREDSDKSTAEPSESESAETSEPSESESAPPSEPDVQSDTERGA